MDSNRPTIFLDLDDVMVTEGQRKMENLHPKYQRYAFDPICVKVLNRIITLRNPQIVLSSDWKEQLSLENINEMFDEYKVSNPVSDKTQNLWKIMYTSFQQLEECRAAEILLYVMKNELTNWVAIDDLNLSLWLPNNFVRCPNSYEGLRQDGIFEKIVNIIK
jgi:hypothetical protein